VKHNLRTLVVTELGPGIVEIRLNRPERLNAVDDVMRDELAGVLRTASRPMGSGSNRVAILTGEGRAFCSGGDFKEFQRIFSDEETAVREMRAYQDLVELIVGASIPIIAAVNGIAAGGGLMLACACDLRIAAASSQFVLSFITRGLSLDMGGSYLLPRLIGVGRTMQLAMTAELMSASDAERIGLVNWTVPDTELRSRTLQVAVGLAERAPTALSAIKRVIQAGLSGDLSRALELETSSQLAALAALGRSE
jgi:2-(1,2-epoxy-1,2-dihydrophenyl)acetyl-CoA isomerase